MPINVFGNSSHDNINKIDTSIIVQKPYLRTYYIEKNIEDIYLKNQFKNKNLPDPISIREAGSQIYDDNLFNDPSILKNTAHIDRNDRKITNARFMQVIQKPQIDSHLTANLYVDNAISDSVDESSLLRLDPGEKLKQDSIVLNSTLTSPKTIIELSTENYVDNKFNDPRIIKNTDHVDFNDKNFDNVGWVKSNKWPAIEEHLTLKLYFDNVIKDIISYVAGLHEINRNRRDLTSVFNDEDNEFDNNKITNLDSVSVNTEYLDDELDRKTVLRFNQTLENYLKVSVGNDTYNLTKHDKIQITDTTILKNPNTGGYLLQHWVIKCNDKNNNSKIQNFIKSTKTNNPTGHSRAESLHPIGNSFMYVETSSNNHGKNVLVSFERTDNFQIGNITFYYNRFSFLTNDSIKSMGRFRIQILLEDNTWSTRYNIPKKDRYSNSSTAWTLVSLKFTIRKYGVKLPYDPIDSAHADMCFSNITITHSVY